MPLDYAVKCPTLGVSTQLTVGITVRKFETRSTVSRLDDLKGQLPRMAPLPLCRPAGTRSSNWHSSCNLMGETLVLLRAAKPIADCRRRRVAMPARKVKEFLDRKHVKYVAVQHSPAYTAQTVAASAHIPAKELAKTVMIMVDGWMAMAVLPASYQIDFDLLKDATGARDIALATEKEFKDRFPDCETGAMPPFGNFYDMPVFVAESLAEDVYIAFSAGSHREVMIMAYEDYKRVVAPRVLKFSAEIMAL